MQGFLPYSTVLYFILILEKVENLDFSYKKNFPLNICSNLTLLLIIITYLWYGKCDIFYSDTFLKIKELFGSLCSATASVSYPAFIEEPPQ
jgi:hypothetical protein